VARRLGLVLLILDFDPHVAMGSKALGEGRPALSTPLHSLDSL
jgi:hypothetical protein